MSLARKCILHNPILSDNVFEEGQSLHYWLKAMTRLVKEHLKILTSDIVSLSLQQYTAYVTHLGTSSTNASNDIYQLCADLNATPYSNFQFVVNNTLWNPNNIPPHNDIAMAYVAACTVFQCPCKLQQHPKLLFYLILTPSCHLILYHLQNKQQPCW